MSEGKDKSTFYLGLDLGQQQDPSALSIIQRVERVPSLAAVLATDTSIVPNYGYYVVRNLKRWQLGTSYPDIVREVAYLIERPPLPGCNLVVDHTGVGRPVVDLFRQAYLNVNLVPITITAGHSAKRQEDGWHVAKKHIAGALQALLQQQRLKVSNVPDRAVLMKEMRAFRIKLSAISGSEGYEAWRSRDHDDLVLSIGIALWFAERGNLNRPSIKVLPFSGYKEKKRLQQKIVVCSREELLSLEVEHKVVVLCVSDPSTSSSEERPQTKLKHVLDWFSTSFADLDAEECADSWEKKYEQWGNKTVNELMMSRGQGKQIWSFLTKKRQITPEVIIIQDNGGNDRRALTMAYAIADTFHYARETCIYKAKDVDWRATKEDKPANPSLYKTLKATRGMVI